MNWYFASRMRHRKSINEIIKILKSKNQSVSYEWSELKSLKPYNENSERSSIIAKQINNSLEKTDIFVMISDKEGTDMFIELGIIIEQKNKKDKIKIYVVGEHNDRSLMHFHPNIIRVKNLKGIFSEELKEKFTKEDSELIEKIERNMNNNS